MPQLSPRIPSSCPGITGIDLRVDPVDLVDDRGDFGGAVRCSAPRSRELMTGSRPLAYPMLEVRQPRSAAVDRARRSSEDNPLIPRSARQDPIIDGRSSAMTRSTHGVESSAPAQGGAYRPGCEQGSIAQARPDETPSTWGEFQIAADVASVILCQSSQSAEVDPKSKISRSNVHNSIPRPLPRPAAGCCALQKIRRQ